MFLCTFRVNFFFLSRNTIIFFHFFLILKCSYSSFFFYFFFIKKHYIIFFRFFILKCSIFFLIKKHDMKYGIKLFLFHPLNLRTCTILCKSYKHFRDKDWFASITWPASLRVLWFHECWLKACYNFCLIVEMNDLPLIKQTYKESHFSLFIFLRSFLHVCHSLN